MKKTKSINISQYLKFPIWIVGIYFLIDAVMMAKNFLGPLILSLVISILLYPLVNWTEKWLSRSLASLIGTLCALIASLVFLFIVALQINNVVEEWPKIESTMKPKVTTFSKYIVNHTPIKQAQVDTYLEQNPMSKFFSQQSESNSGSEILATVTSLVGIYILCFIYIFFILQYRSKFKEFLIRAVPDKSGSKISSILERSLIVVKGYIIGKFKLIGLLFVLYSIGLGISGVSNFLLVSLLAALFTFIPYVGNMIGMGLAFVFGYLTQGDLSILVGILITFTLVQFIESYILQPYVIGSEVSLNPFIVILSVIIGNLIWGILGMLLAIPIAGILKIIFSEIKGTTSLAFLMDKKED